MWPIPPNSCFTITMANKQPTTAIQNGSCTGRFSARRTPVTAALRSNTTQEAAHTAVISKARKPKIMVAAITAGAIAISTSAIIVPVVAVSLKCGAGDTINLLLKAVHLYYLLGAIIFFAILFVTTKCRFAGQT